MMKTGRVRPHDFIMNDYMGGSLPKMMGDNNKYI